MHGTTITPLTGSQRRTVRIFLVYLKKHYGISDAACYGIGQFAATHFYENKYSRKSVGRVSLPNRSLHKRSA